LVGDDREDFHEAPAELVLLRLEKPGDDLRELRLGAELVSTGDSHELESAPVIESAAQLF